MNKKLLPTIASSIFFLANFSSNAQKIGAGYFHSVAICSDSTIRTWGYNDKGQLGNGNTRFDSIPMQINSLTGIKAFAGGEFHSLVLKGDGTVWAWGGNKYGQLGNADTMDSSVPVQVSGLSGIIKIAAGTTHSLAIKNDSTVWVWGDNKFGGLGNGDTLNSNIPIKVFSLTGIMAIAGGFGYSLALKNDGTVWAWGSNYYGNLGNGDTIDRYTPIHVSSLSGVKSISARDSHSLILKKDSTVWAFGFNNNGQLGDGNTTTSTIPVKVNTLTSVIAISAGFEYSLALKSDGTVWAWGDNWYGELGIGDTINKSVPVKVVTLNNIKSIVAGGKYSLAKKSDGTIWAWGRNDGGELGIGNLKKTYLPVQVLGPCFIPPNNPILTVTSINASDTLTCDGKVSVRVKGGFPPYTINFGNNNVVDSVFTKDSLCTGFYTITAVDSRSDSTAFTFVVGSPGTTFTHINPYYVDSTLVDTLVTSAIENCIITYDGVDSLKITSFSFIGTDTINAEWTIYQTTGNETQFAKYKYTKPGVYNLLLDLYCANRLVGLIKGSDQIDIYTKITNIETFDTSTLLVSPNPSIGTFTIKGAKEGTYSIVNELGQIIQQFKLNNTNQYSISIDNLNTGIYFIVGLNNNLSTHQKIVVMN